MVFDFGTLNTSDLCFLLLRCLFTILIVGLVFLHCLTVNATSNSDIVDGQKFEWTINNLEKWFFNSNEGDYYGGLNSLQTHHKNQNLCAVCGNSTTVRCCGCKAVRYCSRKCQIIHWRDGHKEQCVNTQPTKILSLAEETKIRQENVTEKSSEGERRSDVEIHGWSSGGCGSCSISGNSNYMSSRNCQLVHNKSDHNAQCTDSQKIGRTGLISEPDLLAGKTLLVHGKKQASDPGPVLANENTSKSDEFQTSVRGKQREADEYDKIRLCDKKGNSEEGTQSDTKGAVISIGNERSRQRIQGKEHCIDLSTEAALDAQPRNTEQTTQESEVSALLVKLQNQVQEVRQLQENMLANFQAKVDHHKDLIEQFRFLISKEIQKTELCLGESMKAEFVAQMSFLKQMRKTLEEFISSQVEARTKKLKENLQSDFVAHLTSQKHMQEKLQESLNGQVQGALQRAWSKASRLSMVCSVCWTNDQELAFGCGHMSCNDCGSKLSSCHMCRRKITTRLRLFPG